MSKKIEHIIRKVWAGGNDQLLISIPKDKGIVKGDYIIIKKVRK